MYHAVIDGPSGANASNPARGLHVLVTADAVGGVWTWALDLARGLADCGVVTTLAVAGPRPARRQTEAARAIAGLTLELVEAPLDWLARSPREVAAAGRLVARLASRHRVDLVHLASPALAACGAFRVPVVVTCHSCVATWWRAVRGEDALPGDFAWRTALVAQGLMRADHVLAPSAAFARQMTEVYGQVAAPISVVHNGRADVPLPRVGRPSRQRPFAFTAGRLWDDAKNVVMLDRAAAHLDIPVVAAGACVGPDGSQRTFPALELLGEVDAAGVAACLAERPIFVSTALYEPFGLAVLEAAAAGAPLVLSDISTFRELWDGAALFVPPDAPSRLAAVIDEVAHDAGFAHALGMAARKRSERYGIERMVRRTLAAYRSVLDRDRVPRGGSVERSVREAAA